MLAPVTFHLALPEDDEYLIAWYDDESDSARGGERVPAHEILALFAPDSVIRDALAAGVAVVLLSVDMSRICAKYGDRGYRFALLEAGAVWQTMDLFAAERGIPIRAIGGFFDAQCAILFGLPEYVLPVLAVLVGSNA